MQPYKKIKNALKGKFKKVEGAQSGFDFFISIHDFVEFIESSSSFDLFFGKKAARAGEIPSKYLYLKQVYQGIEDIDENSKTDLGHDRYVAIKELRMIRNGDVSEGNSFWKRRELLRKLSGEIYKTLDTHISK